MKALNLRQHRFVNGSLMTKPYDTIIIHSTPGCISDHIEITIEEQGGVVLVGGLPNRREAWELIERISQVATRRVVTQHGDEARIEWVDSPMRACRKYLNKISKFDKVS